MHGEGLVTVASERPFTETCDALTRAIASHGMTLFARIDHADNARQVGLALRPTVVLLFGNPRGGTLLMQERQLAGLDLPARVLVWEDEAGKVSLAYSSAPWLAERHGLDPAGKPLATLGGAVTAICAEAARASGTSSAPA